MDLIIKVSSGLTFRVRLNPDDHVESLKRCIRHCLWLDEVYETQHLLRVVHNGQTLEDGHTLDENKVRPGSTIHLDISQPEIVDFTVETDFGISRPFHLISSVPVTWVSFLMEQHVGSCRCELMFGEKRLNRGSLAENGVVSGSVLRADLRLMKGGNSVFVETPEGKRLELNARNGSYFYDSDYVYDLKLMIQEREGMPVHRQELIYSGGRDGDDDILKDDDTLFLALGAKHSASFKPTLRLIDRYHDANSGGATVDVQIRTFSGKPCSLSVKLSDDVSTLRSRLLSWFGLHGTGKARVATMRLFFNGQELEGKRTLYEYRIRQGSVIQPIVLLPESMTIMVETNLGLFMPFSVRRDDTVDWFRSMIRHSLGIRRFQLRFGGKLLGDGILYNYGIKEGCTITLSALPSECPNWRRNSVPITLDIMMSRKILYVPVHLDSVFDDLKALIQDLDGTPPCEQRLLFAGREVVDNRSLAESGLSEYSKVVVMLRLSVLLAMNL